MIGGRVTNLRIDKTYNSLASSHHWGRGCILTTTNHRNQPNTARLDSESRKLASTHLVSPAVAALYSICRGTRVYPHSAAAEMRLRTVRHVVRHLCRTYDQLSATVLLNSRT